MDEDTKIWLFDATDQILGRLSSHVAKTLLSAQKEGRDERAVIINSENAVVSGKRSSVLANYRKKYELNHARKGPFFPRMPDKILKRTIRGMLPYQKNASGRNAVRSLKVFIGTPPSWKDGEAPEEYTVGDLSAITRNLPEKYVRLGEISQSLGAPMHRIGGGE